MTYIYRYRRLLTTCIVLLFALGPASVCFAQAPDTQWTKIYGGPWDDKGKAIHQIADGGYIVAGEKNCGGGEQLDVYLLKLDSLGDTLWTKTYGGGGHDIGRSVRQTSDAGFVVCGSARDSRYVYLVKTDENGDTLWTKRYNWGTDGWDVCQASDGGYFVAGYTQGNALLIKTDADGNGLWRREYGTQRHSGAYCIDLTSDGGCILGGFYSGDMYDYYFVRTDSLGDTLWTRRYGGANDDRCFCVRQTVDGGYIAVGGFDMLYRWGADVCLMKLDQNGDREWYRMIGGDSDDVGYSVQELSDGGYIIAGRTYSFGAGNWGAYVIRTNSMGDTLWTETYGGPDEDQARSVAVTSDGGYVIAGHTSSFGAAIYDVYIVKIAEDTIGVAEYYGMNVSTSLLEAHPNPFCKVVTLEYRFDGTNGARISIYDISGCLMKQFDRLDDGAHLSVVWNGLDNHGRPVPAGVYFVVLHTSDQAVTQKILLVR